LNSIHLRLCVHACVRACDVLHTLDSYVGVTDDRLANSWIDSYLKTDGNTAASDWTAEFTAMPCQQPLNQAIIPAEHLLARDFLDQRQHDVWYALNDGLSFLVLRKHFICLTTHAADNKHYNVFNGFCE